MAGFFAYFTRTFLFSGTVYAWSVVNWFHRSVNRCCALSSSVTFLQGLPCIPDQYFIKSPLLRMLDGSMCKTECTWSGCVCFWIVALHFHSVRSKFNKVCGHMETSGNFLSTQYHVVIGRGVPTSIISQSIENMLLERLTGVEGIWKDWQEKQEQATIH